ncbi:ABC transporter ATP-binding protein [Pleurocapsa sp. CCALA 161]|uniref:ABC transporter ATP-binding protein n=1 Tax=Pleurocapsa sp. CCALA 161 TaxID=2107688 RepID=UPI0018EC41C4|nr:ABC transporter ATP-binding protein [Pleurocapsa sp. CCALA 161]
MTSNRRFQAILVNIFLLLRLVWQATPLYLCLSLAIQGFQSLIPALMLLINKAIVDLVIANWGNANFVWRPLIVLVALRFGVTFVQAVLTQASLYVGQIFNDRLNLHTKFVLLEKSAQLDLGHFESPEFYDTLARAQDSGSNHPVRVIQTLTGLFGQGVTLVSLLGLLLQFNVAIVPLLFFTALPSFWTSIVYSGRRFWMTRMETESGRVSNYIQQVLTNPEFAKEVRLFNLGKHLLGQWQDIRLDFNQKSAAIASEYTRMRGISGVLVDSGFYLAYIWTLIKTIAGQISVGDFTMYTGAFSQAQQVLPSILENIARVYESNLYVSQYFDFLALQPQVINASGPQPFPHPIMQGLSLKNVSFTYSGASKPTLSNLNLEIKPGESIALVGLNGAGKTTLLKLITRLYDVDSGAIAIDGIPLAEIKLSELHQNIGVLNQDFARYQLSVRDNIGFGNLPQRENQFRIEQAAIASGADRVVDTLKDGYQTRLGKMFKGGVDLSGGQWQKIGMARAFMSDAPILILDEPTAALDAIAEYELFDKFRTLTAGKMTFFVSHRFSTVQLADRIVVLENSQIVEVGSHQELMTHNGLYAEMFLKQASSYKLP